MRRLYLFAAILMLFYLKSTTVHWKIQPNTRSAISDTIVVEMTSFSTLTLNCFFYLVVITCIACIIVLLPIITLTVVKRWVNLITFRVY